MPISHDVVDPTTQTSTQLFNDAEVAELARGITTALNLVVDQVVARVNEQIDEAVARAVAKATPPDTPTQDRLPAWMSIKDAAKHAGRNPDSVYKAIRRCEGTRGREGLRAYQSSGGATWRIHRDDFDLWTHGEPPARAKRRIRR